jgi:putative ABC transport system permease protein
MSFIGQAWRKFMFLLRRSQMDQDLAEEMRQHAALKAQRNIDAGMEAEEARYAAQRQLGNVTRKMEESRQSWGFPFLESVIQDIRYGLRGLCKSPGFTAAAVLTLALGIGANTAVFSIVYGVIFRPLPYPHPDEIVQLIQSSPSGSDEKDITYKELQFLKQQGSPLESLAGYTVVGSNLGVGNRTERVKVVPVSADYFHVLGIKPLLGRDFLPEEDRGNGTHVVILSYGRWQRQVGADAGIVGRTITLDDEPYIVIGIMPPGLEATVDPILPGNTDVWTPLALVGRTVGEGQNIAVLGRLRPGISFAQARAQMSEITPEFRKAFPLDLGPSTTLTIQSYQLMLSNNVRTILLVLFGAVGFVLLIACANVANLLLGRATTRAQEFAVRAALGASRARLIRQQLTESVLLSIVAALFALLLARIGMQSLVALSPSDLPRISDIRLDGWAFTFTLAVAVVTGILFGLVPAFRASSGEIYENLGEATTRVSSVRQHGRFRAALAVSEVALCVILLTGATLMIETFRHVLNTDSGFNPGHVLSMQVWLAGPRYDSTSSTSRYYNQVLERIQTVPGVESAAVIAAGLPLQRGGNSSVVVNGKDTQQSFGTRMILPGYFHTIGIPVLLGRSFSAADNEHSPAVVVISQTGARLLFLGGNPIGSRLNVFGSEREIVGVVGDVKSYLDQPSQPMVYIPLEQAPHEALKLFSSFFPTAIVVRTSAEPMALSHSIEQQVQAVDPTVAVGHIRTMEQVRSAGVAMRQFNMTLLTVFAALALALAAIGIYGVIAYGVTQRKHEFGVRLALGAKPGNILGLVLRQGMFLTGLGILFGAAGALGLTPLLRSYLFGVTPSDPIALVGTTMVLAAVATLACSIPARNATRVDPMAALRHE